ncbi:hypothetical protein Esti_005541 [Eimeria stiedai]
MLILLAGLLLGVAVGGDRAAAQSEGFRLIPDWLPENQASPYSDASTYEYIRSWNVYRPYLYLAQPSPKSPQHPQAQQQQQRHSQKAAAGAGGGECGLVILLNGRDIWEGRRWRFTWTWPWHFFKREFERQAELSKILLLTPQPSKPFGCFYDQVRQVASLLSLSLSLNTRPAEFAGAAAAPTAAAAEDEEEEPVSLRGAGLLVGCTKVRVYVHAACHGSIIARALFARDGRIWHDQDPKVAAAGKAVAELQQLLLSPLFDLVSVSFTAPPLAGLRESISIVTAAAAAGGGALAVTTAALERLVRWLRGNHPAATTMTWGAGSGELYVHRDPARLICSLGAAETQLTTSKRSTSSSSSNSRRGSLLQNFKRISIFSILDSDIVVSPRSSAGVSDKFRSSPAAVLLLQEAEAAAAAERADEAAAAAAGTAATAAAAVAADEGNSSKIPRAFLPHRLPIELAPLNKRAAAEPLLQDIEALLFDDEICTRVQGPRAAHKLFELSLQLVQLWGLQKQLKQQQQQHQVGRGRRLNRLTHFGCGQRPAEQGWLVPDYIALQQHQALQQPQQQQEQRILRFALYIPLVRNVKAWGNTPHFLSFASRSWMVPAAAPLLRAVAAAAIADDTARLERLTVLNTDDTWWHE